MRVPENRTQLRDQIEYDLVVNTTGDPELVDAVISDVGEKTVILLLAAGYAGFSLLYDSLANNTVIDIGHMR